MNIYHVRWYEWAKKSVRCSSPYGLFFWFQVGVSAFMDLFKESPEASNAFVFLKHYSTENEEFYDLLSKHALRVLGIVTLLVKEVNNLRILQKKFLHQTSYKEWQKNFWDHLSFIFHIGVVLFYKSASFINY